MNRLDRKININTIVPLVRVVMEARLLIIPTWDIYDRSRDIRIRDTGDTGIRDTGIPGYRDTPGGIRSYRDTGIPGYRDISGDTGISKKFFLFFKTEMDPRISSVF